MVADHKYNYHNSQVVWSKMTQKNMTIEEIYEVFQEHADKGTKYKKYKNDQKEKISKKIDKIEKENASYIKKYNEEYK